MTNIVENKIGHFTNAIRKSLKEENWYAALSVALTLPDICGKLQNPDLGSSRRYVMWFNDYLKPMYTGKVGPDRIEHVFLSGEDAYALRCSYFLFRITMS
jgi:hypothetical protein